MIRGFSALVATLLFVWLMYAALPVLAPDFLGIYATLLLPLLAYSAADLALPRSRGVPVMVWSVGGILIVFVVLVLSTASLFHAQAYFEQLGQPKPSTLSASLPPLQLQKAPLVSRSMAEAVAQKQLAEVPALGSQVELGPMTKQVVRGELVWVSFLQFRDLFKWASNGTTPGYVVVSAHDSRRARLVTKLNDKPLALRYLPSAWGSSNAERHLYFSGLANVGMTDFSEELDEDGRPYYVATLYKHTVGFSGAEATGVAVLDVQTGEVKRYDIAHTPAWVDRIQPADFIHEQVSNWGEYVHGWLNLSGKDKLEVSSMDLVYDSAGRANYYLGLTSRGRDDGISGFMLLDSRTKAVRRFSLSGANESVAQRAAENVMPEKHYKATDALPYLVNGEVAYVMALSDDTGVTRAYRLVLVRNFQVLAVSDTLESALRQFESKLSQDPSRVQAGSAVRPQTLKAHVARVAHEVHNGNTLYYLMLSELPGKIFVGSSDLSEELILTQPGEMVEVSFLDSASHVTDLSRFHNLELGLAAPVAKASH